MNCIFIALFQVLKALYNGSFIHTLGGEAANSSMFKVQGSFSVPAGQIGLQRHSNIDITQYHKNTTNTADTKKKIQ